MIDSTVRIPIPRNAVEYGVIILVIKTVLSSSSMWKPSSTGDNVLTLVAVALFAYSILNKRYCVRRLMLYAVVTFIFAIICINVGLIGLFITVITCIAICDEDLERIIRLIFCYEFLLVLIHCLFGAIYTLQGRPYYVLYWVYGENISYRRYSLGLGHPNSLAVYAFNLIVMYLWLRFDRLRLRDYLRVIVAEFLVYNITKTRTSLYLFVLTLLLTLFYSRRRSSRFIRFLAEIEIPVFSIFTYAMVVLFESGNALSSKVNKVLTGRILYGDFAYRTVGLTWFGRDMNEILTAWDADYGLKNGGFTFDNIYTYSMMCIGIVVLVMICIAFYLVARRGNLRNNLFILLWGLYAMTEVQGLNCYMLFPILFVALLFGKRTPIQDGLFSAPLIT